MGRRFGGTNGDSWDVHILSFFRGLVFFWLTVFFNVLLVCCRAIFAPGFSSFFVYFSSTVISSRGKRGADNILLTMS